VEELSVLCQIRSQLDKGSELQNHVRGRKVALISSYKIAGRVMNV
jgi:hypothetical protein